MLNCNCPTSDDTSLQEVYHKSDFDFIYRPIDCDGTAIDLTAVDWMASFFTTSQNRTYRARFRAGKCDNCYIDNNGLVHIVVAAHGLDAGRLCAELTLFIADERYPKGIRRVLDPQTLDIELTKTAPLCTPALEASVTVPSVKAIGVTTPRFRLDRHIRKGIMPAKARPGIIYYNYGYIKIKPYHAEDEVYQLEWDLSAFASYYNNPNRPLQLKPMRGNGIDGQYLDNAGNLNETAYEYDRTTHILKFRIPPEQIGDDIFILRVTDAGNANAPGGFGQTPNVMYIDKGGELSQCSMTTLTDAAVYEAPPLSTAEIRAFVNYLCQQQDGTELWEMGLVNFKYWRKKRQGRPSSSGKPNKLKWCLQTDTRSKTRGHKDNPPTTGVIKVMRVSGSGYHSRPVILSICRITGNEKCHYSILN